MTQFNWLQITDLHCGIDADAWLWPNVSECFFEDLAKIHDRCGPWDAILFSGDLVQSGLSEEFKRLNDILDRICRRLSSLGSEPVLATVPENHDLVRPKPDNPALQEMAGWTETPVPDAFWRSRRNKFRRLVQTAFRYYTSWQTEHPFRKPIEVRAGALPGDFAGTIVKDDAKIGILGLNTAFFQLQGGDYEGKLLLSPHQMLAACGDTFTDWLDGHEIAFLMTHHPPSWLGPTSRQALREEIAPPGRFVSHLCGHLHESYQESLAIGSGQPFRLCQGASLFGLEKFGSPQKLIRRHGYTAGRVELQPGQGTSRLWPRRAEKHQGGYQHFVNDPSVTLLDDGGTTAETIVIRSSRRRRRNRPVFRVLILATDRDLGLTRVVIADHLRRSLGVEVREGPVATDAEGYDLVVLLQA